MDTISKTMMAYHLGLTSGDLLTAPYSRFIQSRAGSALSTLVDALDNDVAPNTGICIFGLSGNPYDLKEVYDSFSQDLDQLSDVNGVIHDVDETLQDIADASSASTIFSAAVESVVRADPLAYFSDYIQSIGVQITPSVENVITGCKQVLSARLTNKDTILKFFESGQPNPSVDQETGAIVLRSDDNLFSGVCPLVGFCESIHFNSIDEILQGVTSFVNKFIGFIADIKAGVISAVAQILVSGFRTLFNPIDVSATDQWEDLSFNNSAGISLKADMTDQDVGMAYQQRHGNALWTTTYEGLIKYTDPSQGKTRFVLPGFTILLERKNNFTPQDGGFGIEIRPHMFDPGQSEAFYNSWTFTYEWNDDDLAELCASINPNYTIDSKYENEQALFQGFQNTKQTFPYVLAALAGQSYAYTCVSEDRDPQHNYLFTGVLESDMLAVSPTWPTTNQMWAQEASSFNDSLSQTKLGWFVLDILDALNQGIRLADSHSAGFFSIPYSYGDRPVGRYNIATDTENVQAVKKFLATVGTAALAVAGTVVAVKVNKTVKSKAALAAKRMTMLVNDPNSTGAQIASATKKARRWANLAYGSPGTLGVGGLTSNVTLDEIRRLITG